MKTNEYNEIKEIGIEKFKTLNYFDYWNEKIINYKIKLEIWKKRIHSFFLSLFFSF